MQVTPRVSITIPCYNYAHYLPEAVESVIRQSFVDWEAIVIDDASTDRSWEVMQGFSDPRIRTIRHLENKGNIETYTEGIANSRGEYLAMLSADDRYKPGFLQASVAILDAHPEAGMVYTGHEVINAEGKTITRVPNRVHQSTGVYDELRPLLFGCHIAHSSVVIRRSVYHEVGGYDPALNRAGDWDLWIRTAERHKIGFVSDALYEYRKHGKNMSISAQSVKGTEEQIVSIFGRAVANLKRSEREDRLVREACARHSCSVARLRWIRRDWSGGAAMMIEGFKQEPTLMVSPRLYAQMTLAAVHGMLGRVVWRG